MQAYKIFKMACAFLSERADESDELQYFAPMWLNVILQEALPYENNLRINANLPVLETAPLLLDIEEKETNNINYQDVICRTALPYGLASQFFLEDDNLYLAQDFRARFISALEDATPAVIGSVVDAYA